MTVTTPGVVPTTAAAPSLYTTGTAAKDPAKEMDKEVFLALLVAQLRNQDPTSPMDTTEMMAQSTQMASMEQLTGLTDVSRESFALQMRIAASGLVGQQVSFVDADGVARTGQATGVSFEGEVPTVTVGEWTIPLDAVSAVRSTALSGTTPSGTTTQTPSGTDAGTSQGTDAATTTPAGSAGPAA